jgi:uncharacterized protein
LDTVLHTDTLLMLFGVALVAGFTDTLAGGGGLLTVPALLLAQVPPLQALATNKLQAIFGSFTASVAMLRSGRVRFSEAGGLFVAALAGGASGAVVAQSIDPSALDAAIPIVLGVIAAYFLFAPGAGETEREARLSEGLYRSTAVPAIGFYDGVFGPGTGSFFCFAGVSLRGLDLISATAAAKLLNFGSNLASLAIFLLGGKVLWLVGAVMGAGQALGAYAGAHVVVRGDPRRLKPVIVVVCLAMLVRWLWRKGFVG